MMRETHWMAASCKLHTGDSATILLYALTGDPTMTSSWFIGPCSITELCQQSSKHLLRQFKRNHPGNKTEVSVYIRAKVHLSVCLCFPFPIKNTALLSFCFHFPGVSVKFEGVGGRVERHYFHTLKSAAAFFYPWKTLAIKNARCHHQTTLEKLVGLSQQQTPSCLMERCKQMGQGPPQAGHSCSRL